jgi:polyisoprenyl-teichoic acid--peptidoglycan teichoic acid transferase
MFNAPPGWPDNQERWQGPPTPPEREGPLAVYGPGVAWTANSAQRAPDGRMPPPPAVPIPPLRRSGTTRPGRRRGRGRPVAALVALALVVALLVGLGATMSRLMAFGSAISPHAPLSTQTNYMSGADRVNVVVLGYGGAGHDGAYLSDSIMVMSLAPTDHATTMISIPRDLWVQTPPNSGQYAKLNSVFQDGYNNGYDPGTGKLPPGQIAGGMEAAAKVSSVTGLDVPYFLTINFQGFRELVDALGGVDINVPTAFTARYPINDDPQINAGWKTIHFNTGPQHMNGERAIEYARARYVLQPTSEGTDFARSVRQQLLIRAIVSRLKSPEAWPGLSNALTALQKAIYTNLSLADLTAFTMKMDLSHAAHVGLTNENVLMDGQSADGQDILLPRNGDWDVVRRYVSDHLKA